MPGALCSLLLIFTILTFSLYKLTIILDKSDYIIINEEHDDDIDEDFVFSTDDGFQIAAGVVGGELDPEIGQIKFYLKRWSEESHEVFFDEI